MRDVHAGSFPRALMPALAVALATGLAACAGGPGGPGLPGIGPVRERPTVPALFISPFGEPFVGQPGEPWPSADWFTGADADLDGAVTWEEFEADGLRWFRRLDTDGDGRLTQAELGAYEQSLHGLGFQGGEGAGPEAGGARRGPRPGGGGRPPRLAMAEPQQGPGPGSHIQRGGGGRGPGGYGLVAQAGYFNLPQPVKAADVNVDQRVTAEEWAAASRRWFLSLDTDQDGELTLAALPRTPLQLRAEARDR